MEINIHTLIYPLPLLTTYSKPSYHLNIPPTQDHHFGQNEILEIPRESQSSSRSTDNTYDFNIVGSGSSGSVIVNRLSEIKKWNILLLEVGHPANTLTQIPILAPFLQFTDYNWDYSMEPQENVCLAMQNQKCAWPRGKALGGSSVINYMMYSRGNPKDYDRWSSLGNSGWSYQEVLKYFLKSEHSNLEKFNSNYHNQRGYLSVENPYQSRLTKTFLQAGQEMGYNEVDYNSPDQLGFSRIQATIRHGHRHSVAEAFLEPIANRENLKILTGAKVIKLLIHPLTRVAVGVKYIKENSTFIARATKEVIVCAGLFNSPQLLMLSGIGPKAHLQELGISSLVDLPVGKILYDHIGFIGLIFNTNITTNLIPKLFDPKVLVSWYRYGKGPFSSLGGFEALAYIKTTNASMENNYPDLELILSGVGNMHTDYGLINRRTIRVRDDFYYRTFKSLEGKPGFTIIPILLHPKSKGHLKLKSKNHYDYPLLYGNYLTDLGESDLKTLIAGIRFIIKLSYEHLEYDSGEYWKCALQLLTITIHHQTSTCKMGSFNDSTSVVDYELKVHGVRNLRVADSSVIPTTLSAHTNAPAIMIGEKAADLIKEHWDVL